MIISGAEIFNANFPDDVFGAIGENWMLAGAAADGRFNAMTAAWGGLGVMWRIDAAFAVIRRSRFTKEFFDKADTFSLSFLDHKEYAKEYAYFGSVSGRDEDKVANSGLKLDVYDGTPYFSQSQTALICRKVFSQYCPPESFTDKKIVESCYPDGDFHTLYVGEVLKVIKKERA